MQPTERGLLDAWFRSTPNPHFEDAPLWVLVKEAFLVGRTRAHEICAEYGQDPDREVPGLGSDGGVCAACRSWRCSKCENLTHVPDGSGPECSECEEEVAAQQRQATQEGTPA